MRDYYDDYDENDEMPDGLYGRDYDGYGFDNGRIKLDDPEEIEMEMYGDNDDDDDEIPIDIAAIENDIEYKNTVAGLRAELKRDYFDRGVLSFRYNGEDYEGIPMTEVSPGKFMFEINGTKKLKAFAISDITIS